ncbi:MAG: ATP-binding cassette domain-containing protein [Tannerellaceae bacterium]|jgi:zinc transport system ATP-binding protein|nr:ATP-binding cassette domain-containing protein [Tannerellaceae bacterium]
MNELIVLENISAAYTAQAEVILKDVSLTLYKADFLGITGPNGGGKTTLLKIILGLLKPVGGSIRFFQQGEEVASLKMGYLPQVNLIDKKYPISVREVISSGLVSDKPLFRSFSREQRQRIDRTIEQMGLAELARRPIGELSGGQLQRTLLGRAIIGKPKVLILDEPDSYIDTAFETHFYELLGEIRHESAVILVSHNLANMEKLATRIIRIDKTIIL